MKRELVNFAQRERRRLVAFGIEAGIVFAIFVLAVVIGPFGTFVELSLADRCAYWGMIIVMNWAQVRSIHILLTLWLGQEKFWRATIAASLIASIPATFEVLWLEATFRTHNVPLISFQSLFPQVAFLTLAIMIPVSWFVMGRQKARNQAENLASMAPPGAAFLKRLPIALGKQLYALQAEDHYIRVYTAAGDDLVLYRFSDAMEELRGYSGMQVHRSWWVAEDALADVARHDRKVFLVLKNGVEAPVSRTYAKAVRDAGWLA